jgi:general nucleoside transport system ATP-binding protein
MPSNSSSQHANQVLELRNITKAFPGVLANDHIDLSLQKGEIHALLGENGAGKTTLMNVLYGLYGQDEGEIFINNKAVKIQDPNDAIAQGIGMVHQHFMLVPVLTVTENVMLGVETIKNGIFLDRDTAAQRIRQISEQYGLEVDPNAYIKNLPVGLQQRVEIIKLLYREADILILDEPTAVLTPQEVDDLFKVIQSLVDQGKSVIFITHKLKEVISIADRITVLRNGRVVGTTKPEKTTEKELAAMMVGREVVLQVEKDVARVGDVVLEVEDIHVMDDRGNVTVQGVSLEVCEGQILGIAGVQGNGQTELVEALTGLRKSMSGQVHILDNDLTNASPRRILEQGMAHVPEDRQKDGLVLSFPVADNLVLNTYYVPPFAHFGMMDHKAILEAAEKRTREFDVRTPSVMTPVSSLSGGNQQKVIVAREFSRPIHLLIASQPTRGLDVGSIEYIHSRIIEKRDEGTAVLLVSSELDEVMGLADLIAVIYEGKIVDILPAAQATREEIGLLMAGAKPDTAPSKANRKETSGANIAT